MPHRKLQDLSLPMSLDMLDRPLDLPPSLLGKAREVRSEDGLRRVRGMIEDVQKLAAQDRILLNTVSVLAPFPLPSFRSRIKVHIDLRPARCRA